MFGKEKSLLEQENEEFRNSPASEMYNEYNSQNNSDRYTQPQQTPPPQYNPFPQNSQPFNPQGAAVNNTAQGGFSQPDVTLFPDEHVLWQGVQQITAADPAANSSIGKTTDVVSTVSKIYSKVFAVIWLLFSIFWTVTAFGASPFMGLFGVPFIIVGICLLFNKNFGHKGNRRTTLKSVLMQNYNQQQQQNSSFNTIYTITNKRVITKAPYGINIDMLNNLFNISYQKTLGSTGTISYSKAVGDNMQSGEIANIANVENVYCTLTSAVNNIEQR